MSEREYVVGLPVVITVHDDGKVDYWVDTSEAGESIFDTTPLYGEDGEEIVITEDQMIADREAIENDHVRRHATEEGQ